MQIEYSKAKADYDKAAARRPVLKRLWESAEVEIRKKRLEPLEKGLSAFDREKDTLWNATINAS